MVVLKEGFLRIGWGYGNIPVVDGISNLPKEALSYSLITYIMKT